ncbi:hypothetical protein BKA63DRAFT_602209 [Paraphoma chrysanthemicola]|nr:hypothetical protein BKA63DRAFT_602209 [Paraphoma chrysanthemicola]
MAPALRKSTRTKTNASAKAAKAAGYVRRPPTRRQRYKCNKGLVSMKIPKDLEHSTVANAVNSPLLRLPREIRHTIFSYAMHAESDWVGLYHNRCDRVSRSGTSTRARRYDIEDLSVPLPRVSRQIYSETATVLYSENCFAFKYQFAMFKWLSKRLLAQREAIRWIILPSNAYEDTYKGERWYTSPDLELTTNEVRKTCPNLEEMEEDDTLDRWLFGSPAPLLRDRRNRSEDPSSDDYCDDSS